MVKAQHSICPGKWDAQTPMGFWDADQLISARRPYLVIINKRWRNCKIVGFAVPADHRVKLKEREKYINLARELKKLEHDSHYYHHHHHLALVARISLTLSRHSFLSFIALGRSSGQYPVSSHSCWIYVRAGRPTFARPCVGIHKSTYLMSSSLLLQQCPACLVRLTWIVFVIGGRWPYSWCLVGCCCQDLFRIARSILV